MADDDDALWSSGAADGETATLDLPRAPAGGPAAQREARSDGADLELVPAADETHDLTLPAAKQDEAEGEAAEGEEAPEAEEVGAAEPALPDWVPDFLVSEGALNRRVLGALGVVALLLLTALLLLVVRGPPGTIAVPGERFGDRISYRIDGSFYQESDEYAIPIQAMGLNAQVNEAGIEFEGFLNASTRELTARQVKDGYANPHAVFERWRELSLTRLAGSFKENGKSPTELDNGRFFGNQTTYLDRETSEAIRSDTEANLSYEETAGDYWNWQRITEWVPRAGEKSGLPHGELYVGKTIEEGTTGKTPDGLFTWEVTAGERVRGQDTLRLRVSTGETNTIVGTTYQYGYRLDLWLSEEIAYPLKFTLHTTASFISGNTRIFDQELWWNGTALDLTRGLAPVPPPSGGGIAGPHRLAAGEILPWDDGAPAFGNGSSSLDRNFSLQVVTKRAEAQTGLGAYRTNNPQAFVTNATYNETDGRMWNFTFAYHSEQSSQVEGYNSQVNETNATGRKLKGLDTPAISMEDMPKLLSVTGAEQVLTATPLIAAWAAPGNGTIDHRRVQLRLSQNIITPAVSIDFSRLSLTELLRDFLEDGRIDPARYTTSFSPGGYGYLIESHGSRSDYIAGVDAQDGLVLFNREQRSSA